MSERYTSAVEVQRPKTVPYLQEKMDKNPEVARGKLTQENVKKVLWQDESGQEVHYDHLDAFSKLFLRNMRAMNYHKLLEVRRAMKENMGDDKKAEWQEERVELRRWRQAAAEIVKQSVPNKEIEIELPDGGRVKAGYLDVKLPPELVKDYQESEKKQASDPLFLILGNLHDYQTVFRLAVEAAQSGQQVVVVGQPDAVGSGIDSQAAKWLSAQKGFAGHAKYFELAMRAILGQQIANGGKVELMGYSTGSPVIANMLGDERIAKDVSRAVMMAPSAMNRPSEFLRQMADGVGEIKEDLVDKRNTVFYESGAMNTRLSPAKGGEMNWGRLGLSLLDWGRNVKADEAYDQMAAALQQNPELKIDVVYGGRDRMAHPNMEKLGKLQQEFERRVQVKELPDFLHSGFVEKPREAIAAAEAMR